jgi:putative peptidoglycan lipid II flippase
LSNILKKLSGSTRRVTFGLSIIQLFKAFLSFFTVIISSIYFGTSFGRDIWILSLSIVAILGSIIFGPVYQIFRAKFIMIKEGESEEKALKAVGSLLMYMLIISTAIIIAAEIVPAILGKTFAPTYTDEQQQLLRIMIRLIAPTMFFSIIISIISGVLNVYNVFYVPEIMAIFTSLLNVVIILLFAPTYGIYSLVLSGYLSNIILIIVLLVVIRKSNIKLFHHINLDFSYTLVFFKFALPFYFNYLIAQVLLAVERIISTFLGVGSLSVLDYARKFVDIPISMIQSTVNMVLTTNLTRIYIKEGERSFILELNKFIDMIILITLPLMTLLVICPVEIVRIFLLRGSFDPKFLLPTAHTLFWFGFAIVSITFYASTSQALLAQGKNKISAIISALLGFFILLINLLFYKKYGIQVLAFSWTAAHFIGGVLMYFILSLKESKLLFKEFMRKMGLLFIVQVLCFGIYQLIIRFMIIDQLVIKSLITIGIMVIFSMLVELMFIYILRFKEKEFITKTIKAYVFNKPSRNSS